MISARPTSVLVGSGGIPKKTIRKKRISKEQVTKLILSTSLPSKIRIFCSPESGSQTMKTVQAISIIGFSLINSCGGGPKSKSARLATPMRIVVSAIILSCIDFSFFVINVLGMYYTGVSEQK